MSTAKRRPESGPMKFGDDWTGVFLRGDYACPTAIVLKNFLECAFRGETPSMLDGVILRDLVDRLSSCEEGEGEPEELQPLLSFEECAMGRQTLLCPPPEGCLPV